MPAAKQDSLAAKRKYHHGDLRRALLEAAWHLVAEKGLAALTLREVARTAGVTHAAPYHHFPTRTALLDALAEEGFTGLDRAMGEAKAACAAGGPSAEPPIPGAGDPVASPADLGEASPPVDGAEVLYRIGRAYVDFACAHPEQLQVMFRPRHHESEGPPPPALAEIGAKAFAHLNEAVRTCQAQGLAPPGDCAELALSAWSLVHGFATLWCQGQLGALIADGDSFASGDTFAAGEAFAQQRDRLLRNLQAGWQATAAAPGAQTAGACAASTV